MAEESPTPSAATTAAAADGQTHGSSLDSWYRHHGATFDRYRGVATPSTFGDSDGEYEALRSRSGWVDGRWLAVLALAGEDRIRFLNGLVTCDVKELQPGTGIYGFFTSVKGRILADVAVLAAEDRLWLILPAGARQEIADHVRKYVIVDRVEVEEVDRMPFELIGPGAGELLSSVSLPDASWDHREVELFSVPVRIVRVPDLGAPRFRLWVEPSRAEALMTELLRADDCRLVGYRAYDRLRIEQGVPAFGVDFDSANFPQETGLEEAVSYTKGCYLGQEVVARIHYRGGVNRRVCGLVLPEGSAGAQVSTGAEILHEGRAAGTLTSLAVAGERDLGLAVLHKRVEPGADVAIGSATAKVAGFPLKSSEA